MKTAEAVIVYFVLAPLAVALLILEKVFKIKLEFNRYNEND